MSDVKTAKARPGGLGIPAIQASTHQVVSTSITSAQSSAFGASTTLVRIVSDVACFIKFGSSPTATTSDILLPANTVEFWTVDPSTKVAAILASGTGSLYVTEAQSDDVA